jgi:hypothetical protein
MLFDTIYHIFPEIKGDSLSAEEKDAVDRE